MDSLIKYYPLTHPQKGIWYTEMLYPHTSIENIAGTFRIMGYVDYPLLERAINVVLQKNEPLHLRITEIDGEPVQYFSEYCYLKLDFIDFSLRELDRLFKWDEEQTRKPFNLFNSPLFYFAIIKISENEGGIYIKFHHLLSDAWTIVSVASQIIETYWSLKNNLEISEEKKPSYKEFIQRETDYENSDKYLKDMEFWNSKFDSAPEVTSLKTAKASFKGTDSRRKTYMIPVGLATWIHKYCADNKVSIFIFLLSVFAVYLNRVTAKKDIIVGTPVLNRSSAREKNMAGMFVSTVPLKVNIDDEMDFGTFAQSVSKEWMQILRHYEYPYDILLKDIREKYKSMENLYDIIFSYQNAKLSISRYMNNYKTRWHFNGHQTNSLSIHINERDGDGNLVFDYDFLKSMFTVKEMEYIHKHLLVLIQDIMRNPQKKIFQMEIMEEDEKRKVLFDFNNTKVEYRRDKSIQQLFEEQAARTPDQVAVVFRDIRLTYRELNEKSNKLARLLVKKGVGPDNIAAIMMYRSAEIVVGIIAVLKAGGAFMPIDPDYPEERARFVLEDSGAKVLLTQTDLMNKIKPGCMVVNLEDASINKESGANLKCKNKPTDLGYVIYTSGSTGNPKGVMLERKGLNNLFKGMTNIVDFSEGKTIVSITTISFDIFIFETLLPLLRGLKVVIADEAQLRIPRLLKEVMLANGVDMIQTTPSRMQQLLTDEKDLAHFRNLSEIVLGGEAFPQKLLEKLRKISNAKIYNGYGPTETTVYSTFKDMTNASLIDIGKPIANTYTYILDKYLNPLPVGVPGDLYIGGEGVARGYLNRPELNLEKFICNPFGTGGLLFKTGDLARWYPNGDIEYLGRIDHQVKIRGLRIELGEIENQILKYSGVKKVVVIDRNDAQGRKYLCAYIVTEGRIVFSEMRAFLAKQLPSYMIPHYFMEIENIPLNMNGKISRSQLPEPDLSIGTGTAYSAPSNNMEEKLVEIWRSVLQTAKVGVKDSFFELGGDSLSLVSVITKIHKEFDVEVPLSEIYKSPTVRELGEYIASAKKTLYMPIRLVEHQDYYPMSPAQKRIYILMQQNKKSIAYNTPGIMLLKGKLDKNRFEKAWTKLVNRHEALRTSFCLKDGEPVQRIMKNLSFKVDFEVADEKDISTIAKNFIKPFDLDLAPLLRVKLLKLSEDKYAMLFDMHHIISDGATIEIIMRELDRLYKGESLSELDVQYKDYSAWMNELLKSDFIEKQEAYWLRAFDGEIPVLDLPADYPRPAASNYKGNVIDFSLGKQLTRRLKKTAADTGATLFMVLLAAYNILLSKYTGQEDIVIGTPVSGRRHADLENIVGMFVNTLAFRNFPEGKKSFEEFLDEVKENSLLALENQDYQFEELVSKLKVSRDIGRNPLFDTMFILQAAGASEMAVGDLKVTSCKLRNNIAKFDLTMEAVEKNEEIRISLEYRTELFRKATIVDLVRHFKNILSCVIENSRIRLSEISLLSSTEKNRIIYDFNNTQSDYPKNKTIHQLFEEQVERSPFSTAVVFNEWQLTYRQLNEKSNQLARVLREKGVKRDSIVGIMVRRSIEMIVGIMGVLKAGGAYLPIDPDYPDERIEYMLLDSDAAALITQKEFKQKVKRLHYDTLRVIETEDEAINSQDDSNLENINETIDLAYVIYTSGTTGKPKGVMLNRGALNNLVRGVSELVDFSPEKTVISTTTVSFDIFIFETLIPLVKGLKVVIADEEQQRLPMLLNEVLVKNSIDILQATPSRMQLLIEGLDNHDAFKNLKDIMLAGEVFPDSLYRRLRKLTNANIYNGYGPTETTVYSTIKLVTGVGSLNIGRPITNTQIYILDKNLDPVPIGVAGELCISGDGVGRGYLKSQKLTEEKFVQNPFIPGGRLYRTGDLAKWLTDGNIEYLGRKDHQIKLRGLRIELGEIENELLLKSDINKAVVIDRDDSSGNKYLCAYVVSDKELSIPELREFLSRRLPRYMIPSFFIRLDSMPLTPNGKVNRKALPEPDKNTGSILEYEAPENGVEEKLLKIWQEVLKLKRIGVNDNFFELGGDSLSIIQVQAKAFQYDWGVATQEFYKYQTIKDLSKRIMKTDKNSNQRKEPSEIDLDLIEMSCQESAATSENRAAGTPVLNDVFLTGATGFLGTHILSNLLTDTTANIHCLIRGEDDKVCRDRLERLLEFYFPGRFAGLLGERIFIVKGDMTHDRFGLSELEYSELGRKVDSVVHVAADVKHFGSYTEFEKVNVTGTQRVIDFTQGFGKVMYHISTMSVAGDHIVIGKHHQAVFTENDFYIGQNLEDNVYVRSKFEAEKLVLKAMNLGLNAAICRIGNLTGRYSDGHFQINIDKNAFYNRLRAIIKTGAVSEELLDMAVEFTPVDFCSKAILKLMTTSKAIGRVFHIYNHKHIRLRELLEVLNACGFAIKILDRKAFEVFVHKISEKESRPEILAGMIYDFNNKDSVNKPLITVKSEITYDFLQQQGFKWPEIDKSYLCKLIEYMNSSNYLSFISGV